MGAVAAAALVVATAGIWTLTALSGGGGGAASPQAAVTALLDDLAGLDFPKAISRLAPSERATAQPWIDQIAETLPAPKPNPASLKAFAQLQRALQIEFADLEFASQTLAEGVVREAVTAGQVTIDADTAALAGAICDGIDQSADPGKARALLGIGAATTRAELQTRLDNALPITKSVADLAKSAHLPGLFAVTVKEEGRWYTSPSMTLAQYAFEAAGGANQDLGQTIPADQMTGAGSPEDAIGLLAAALDDAAAAGDLRQVAKALPLAESRLLAVYGPALHSNGEPAQNPLAGLRITQAEGTEFKAAGRYATVTVDQLTAEIAGAATFTLVRDAAGPEWELGLVGDGLDYAAKLRQPDRQSVSFEGATWVIGIPIEASGGIAVTSQGHVASQLTLLGRTSVARAGGNCVAYGEVGAEAETCQDGIGRWLAALGLDQVTELPELEGLMAYTALKGADGKWYVSAAASPLFAWAAIALNAGELRQALSNFASRLDAWEAG
ncbi:MAG: hypothetical protein LBD51_10085 [Bifidobacteriaceae bacterium]|nr:hypothetical protein [Bifidobacteriaceae bacterium]